MKVLSLILLFLFPSMLCASTIITPGGGSSTVDTSGDNTWTGKNDYTQKVTAPEFETSISSDGAPGQLVVKTLVNGVTTYNIIQAPLQASATATYVLPVSSGNINQVMILGDDGQFKWVTFNSTGSIQLSVDGSGSAVTVDSGTWVCIEDYYYIDGFEVTSDVSGSIQVDIKTCTYATFGTWTSITGTEKPTLTGATKAANYNPTTWTRLLNPGTYIRMNIESASTSTKVTVRLILKRL
jgi:hypothetical protein